MEFKLVDAFTTTPLSGNPCAVVLGAEHLSDGQMLAIAKEMNQSETAFLMRSEQYDLKARYFTPEREIPLAGHPTIASVHAALESSWIHNASSDFSISLELPGGPIQVDIQRREDRALIKMFQRQPQFLSLHDPQQIASIFAFDVQDLISGVPIQTVFTGTNMMMVPLQSKQALRKVQMDVDAYRAYRATSDFFSPHFFVLSGETPEGDTFARHLGVPPDTMEDAFTGSATGCMAAFLWKYGLMKKKTFVAEQGHWMSRPGSAVVEAVGEFSALESVAVAGRAVTVVTGQLVISQTSQK